jgi:hypothetical protein
MSGVGVDTPPTHAAGRLLPVPSKIDSSQAGAIADAKISGMLDTLDLLRRPSRYLALEHRMTLTVHAYVRDSDGEMEFLPVPSSEGAPELAGIESTRYTFYGSVEARKLGLTILPMLAEVYGVHIEGENLNELQNEVETLLKSLSAPDEYWPFRLNNILRAIEVAKAHAPDGCVVIW